MLVSAESGECHAACSMQRCREVKMSELSCDTPFIGQIETHDLSLYMYLYMYLYLYLGTHTK